MSKDDVLTLRFWGVRGSIPAPGLRTARYGGNTPCVELRVGHDQIIIIDCGSGLRELGLDLQQRPHPIIADILLSHTHWDHIQGFPFFAPAFVPGNRFTIHACAHSDLSLEATLSGQMQYRYFPVSLERMAAVIEYDEIADSKIHLGRARVTASPMNHPSPTVGYRIEWAGKVVVYATDTEPPPRSAADRMELDQRVVALARGADLLVHDAQYTEAEYAAKVGWGHSTAEYAVELAATAGARRLALFHHDPTRTDDALDEIVARCQALAAAQSNCLEVFAAAEGYELEL